MPYDPQGFTLGRGVGCALVLPTAFMGTALIVDYPGPPGRFGALEFFGWWGLCFGVSFLSAALIDRCARERRYRFLFLCAGIAVPAGFAALSALEAHPDTPAGFKVAVEYTLQVLGASVVAMVAGMTCWIGLNSRRG